MHHVCYCINRFFGLGQDPPCSCCSENHKAFDFWIGTWEVLNADGTQAGTNKIEKIQGNCILIENWTSADGKFTGTSMNFFNPETKLWEQLWIDNAGTHLRLKGNRSNNKMILLSDGFTRSDGLSYMNRITSTLNKDGTVRQLWEVLREGDVANVAFDGLYQKMK